MFKIGETVNYGTNGVCKITDIRKDRFGSTVKTYYVLQPTFKENSKIYVPSDNENLVSKMRTVLSRDEIYDLIRSIPSADDKWIADDNERADFFKAALRSGDRARLFSVIRIIHARQKELAELGRKLRNADAAIIHEAESLLYNEFAYVLDIKPEDVLPMIFDEINKLQEA